MPFFQEASGTNANDGVFNDVQGSQTNNATHTNTNNTNSENTTTTKNTNSRNNSSTNQTIEHGSGGIVLGKRGESEGASSDWPRYIVFISVLSIGITLRFLL